MSSRRNFLKIAGAGFTGSLIKPISSSASESSVSNSSVKIGVLLPRSNEHQVYSNSFLNGLRLATNHNGLSGNNKIEIITEQVNYGSCRITRLKAGQLIAENNINLLVGLLNSDIAIEIGDLVKNAKVPTIIANAGENYLVNKAKENPWLFFNSLNLFQNSFLAGKTAVEKYGKNIAVITALYDSGYDSLFAFYKGVELAGGKITETYLRNEKDVDFISKTLDRIKKETVNGIYVLLNGNLADDFFRTISQEKLSVPIITTSFACDENRIVNLGGAANGIQSFQTWTKNLNNRENQDFVSAYKKKYSRETDQFGFLGYETGLIINDSLSKCQGNISGNQLAYAIRNCKINSPGGKIYVNEKSGMVNNPVYLCETKMSGMNIPENEIIEQYTSIGEFDVNFIPLDTNLRSGFVNPYLFV
jgi:ABC-type branched-subunit amino acid transport system substrate-binding protein